jgi:hypothetical protein
LAKPFAASVEVKYRSSSSRVTCPMMEMCAPLAVAGLFFVSTRNSPVSHACRMSGLSVEPSRPITRKVEASSVSITKSLLSETPGFSTIVW